MHTYIKAKNDPLWTVGYYRIVGDEHCSSEHVWEPLLDFSSRKDAAAYVNYLNGGTGEPQPDPK